MTASASAMGDVLLSVQDLKVHFPVPQPGLFSAPLPLKAVDGVSFDVRAGETLGIVGESGCGKSTLGRAILQLLEPTAGRIVWLTENIAGLSERRMRPKRKELQIIFQDPLASLNPRMTVGDIIAEPLDSFFPRMKRDERKRRVQDMMQKVGLLPEMINRYPHEFSGGQCQRIGIARAMILGPKLIICDEPVSALDVSIRAQIVNLLKELQREFNLSLIFISHDLSVIRHESPDSGALSRPGDGACGFDNAERASAPSLYGGAAVGGAHSRPRNRAGEEAGAPQGRSALADQSAIRMRLPHALPEGAGPLRTGSTGASVARIDGRQSRRLPLPELNRVSGRGGP